MNRGVCLPPEDLARCGTPPEVRSSGGRGGSGDGETGTSPRVPNFPVMRRNPRRKFANFQRARREDAGSPRGGRRHWGPALPGPKPKLPPPCRAAHRRWWRAPGNEGAITLGGHLPFTAGVEGSTVARLSPRLHSCSRLCLCPVLVGIVTSSPPLPQMTAPAFDAAAVLRARRRSLPSPTRFSTE